MKVDLGVVVQTASAAFSASAFSYGLNWPAVLSAVIGAAAAYYLKKRESGTNLFWHAVGILVLAFFSAMLASAIPAFPNMKWSSEVAVEIRSALIPPVIILVWEARKLWEHPVIQAMLRRFFGVPK